jgi:hypothetical protein
MQFDDSKAAPAALAQRAQPHICVLFSKCQRWAQHGGRTCDAAAADGYGAHQTAAVAT